MILLIILIVLLLLATVFVMWVEGGARIEAGVIVFLVLGSFLGFIFVILQGIGMYVNSTITQNTFSQPIASLSDGTGIEGKFSGSLFVYRGNVNDTQHFSYYRVVSPGSYVLEKRDASATTIHTDATPETARIDITDTVKTCRPSWWVMCDESKPKVNFVHADFHVPPNSIENNFTLDAQ